MYFFARIHASCLLTVSLHYETLFSRWLSLELYQNESGLQLLGGRLVLPQEELACREEGRKKLSMKLEVNRTKINENATGKWLGKQFPDLISSGNTSY